jgi:hypothetical protein
MEQAWEALKKLNVFAEKAGRIALVPWGMMAPGSLESVSSERHQSFAFRHLRHVVGYASCADSPAILNRRRGFADYRTGGLRAPWMTRQFGKKHHELAAGSGRVGGQPRGVIAGARAAGAR